MSAASSGTEVPRATRERVARRLDGKRPAVFLDYDGTLTPIVSRPELATLSEGMEQTLRRLASTAPVAIVSGRDREDVQSMVGIDELVYAGSHGFDIKGPNIERINTEAEQYVPALNAAETELKETLASVHGVLIERKRYAIAAHYRNVPEEQVREVEHAVDAAAEKHSDLRKTGGKKILELRPKIEWDKGRAVLWLLDELGFDRPDVVPIYLGDDETDEDAFRAIEHRGIGILVAGEPQSTHAHFVLPDVSSVERFLSELTDMLNGPE